MAIKNIGLLGGSFDPVHNTHIELAKAAISHLGLDELQLIPANHPWQKNNLITSAKDRLAMLELASANIANIKINTIELQRSGQTYTIDTLEQLPKNANYFWIMGTDQLINFCTWYRWIDILNLVKLAVAIRPDAEFKPPSAIFKYIDQDGVLKIPFTPSNLSSTDVRRYIQQQADLSAMLHPAVISYIQNHNLYGFSN